MENIEIDSQHNFIEEFDLEPFSQNEKVAVESKKWLYYAFASSFCLTIVNEVSADLNTKVGPASIFYIATGQVVLSMGYLCYDMFFNHRQNGTWWPNHNLIINGKLKTKNLIGFLSFCLIFFLIQNMALLSIYFA